MLPTGPGSSWSQRCSSSSASSSRGLPVRHGYVSRVPDVLARVGEPVPPSRLPSAKNFSGLDLHEVPRIEVLQVETFQVLNPGGNVRPDVSVAHDALGVHLSYERKKKKK